MIEGDDGKQASRWFPVKIKYGSQLALLLVVYVVQRTYLYRLQTWLYHGRS